MYVKASPNSEKKCIAVAICLITEEEEAIMKSYYVVVIGIEEMK
jgi:hypothetical protein